MITGEIEGSNELHGVISGTRTINGVINGTSEIYGGINRTEEINGTISGEQEISGNIGVYDGEAPPDFDGDYAYTSDEFEDYTVDVRHKRMTGNLTIRKIPYYETSNPTGTTVIIGD